ncbi:MAG: hypothetical protein Tsb009_22430 [Planctomycetaceae bacterium]
MAISNSQQKLIRIGNGAGFWGDNLDAPRLLVENSRAEGLDYLTLEYLAELTMSILAHQRRRNPDTGYVTDFLTVMQSLLPHFSARENPRIVTNAGGMNPAACAKAVSQLLVGSNLNEIAVAAVSGDDLLPELDAHLTAGEVFANIETGAALEDLRERVACANVYLGAEGIVSALQQNADVVITGRVADAALTIGPAVHEFGWTWNDWDNLAAATTAGHLIECGAQVTGGMYSDWDESIALDDVGYPIAELSSDGAVVITKPEKTGGLVSPATVSEQLIYEIGDPRHYLTPDVGADFSQITLQQIGENRVQVQNAQGQPRPERLKVSLAYADGFRATGMLVIAGRNAISKARHCGEIIRNRLKQAGSEPAEFNVECIGAGDSLPGIWPAADVPWDVMLRVSARDSSREVIERFSREFAPLVTSGPPGVTGYTGGRVKPIPVLSYWPTTISRERISATVDVRTAQEWLS